MRQYEEQIRLLKEQLGGGGMPIPAPALSGDNNNHLVRQLENEKRQMEMNLREKDNMLTKTNADKDKLASKIHELEREMGQKMVINA